jgi:FtsP/CotA-like multicopper oxidase with cupredoxin domain
VTADIDQFRPYFDKSVDKTLRLTIEMGMMGNGNMRHGNMMGDTRTDGIEWEDDNAMNAQMPAGMMKWKMTDEATGKENMDIDWQFKKGDIVKVRVINDEDSAHPMQHPMHFHGQRFLVLSIDGKVNENLVWKDTVQIPAGSTADLLFDMSNPGDWMFHCHIAEHLTDGMMGMMQVSDK